MPRSLKTQAASAAVSNLYFVGVTTQQSSIRELLPIWDRQLGLNTRLVGLDIRVDAAAADYRDCVETIRADERAVGALVTTHKAAIYDHARDKFAVIDYYAEMCREISCVARRGEKLEGFAKDPTTAGLAMDHMFATAGPAAGRDVVCFGAGGAGIAITTRLLTADRPPAKIVLVDRDPVRIAIARSVHDRLGPTIQLEYFVHADPASNDAILAHSLQRSFVINATGMGKDVPGSPLSPDALFPEKSLVWDLNYRGDLLFLGTAREQAPARALEVHDGWRYFLHGWTEVISELFGIEMTTGRFHSLAAAAEPLRERVNS